MLLKELKEAIPCWQGFARVNKGKIYCLYSNTTKTGWVKAKENEFKLKDFEIESAPYYRNNFLGAFHDEDTGVGIEHRHLYEYVNDAVTEKGKSPLKDKLNKWCKQVNRRRVYPVQIGVLNDSLYVIGQEYLIVYLGVLVGVVVEDTNVEPWEEVTYYVRDMLDKTPNGKRNKTKNMDFKETCEALLEKIELIEKKVKPENCLCNIPMKKIAEMWDDKMIDKKYRVKPLAFEKKIIEAVGDKYYLERIHGQKNTAIIKTKDEKYFVGVYTVEHFGMTKIIGYAMGDTDGRTLFDFNIPSIKELNNEYLKSCIEQAMKDVKRIV